MPIHLKSIDSNGKRVTTTNQKENISLQRKNLHKKKAGIVTSDRFDRFYEVIDIQINFYVTNLCF